jgi:hypothetical protein
MMAQSREVTTPRVTHLGNGRDRTYPDPPNPRMVSHPQVWVSQPASHAVIIT